MNMQPISTTTPSTTDLDAAVFALASPWRDTLQNFINELELRRQLAARRQLLGADAPRLGRPRKL